MSEKFLHRNDAPFDDKVWEKIDEAVVGAAKSQLCGRRVLKVQGPYGLGLKVLPSGDSPVEEKTVRSASMAAPCVTPLAMIQSTFSLPVRDVAAFEQTGLPFDPGGAAQAAIDCARQEDNLVFNGSKTLGVKGLLNMDNCLSAKLKPWDEVGAAAADIIQAVTALDTAGFHGPYTLGLAPERFNALFRRYPQGNQTEMEHLRQMATDGIVKLPGISAAGILICSCTCFAAIVLGQDIMAGFVGPAGGAYEFTVSESVALYVHEPRAFCILK